MSSKRQRGSTLPRRAHHAAPPTPPRRGNDRRKLLGIVAGIAVLATVGVIIAGALTRGSDDITVQAVAPSNVPVQERTKGNPNAPVTIIEFADFQCSNCANFALTTEREIERLYVETGIAKIEYRHFAFLGKESLQAAEASECAAEQGKFSAYRDAVFASHNGVNKGTYSEQRLASIAQSVGMDTGAFNACMASNRNESKVRLDTAQGEQLGVEGTPTFFINGIKVVGAQPLDVFKRAIEQAAAIQGAAR